MIDFETHSCGACGEQFVVACLSELQEKLKKHLCRPERHKGRKRSRQFQQDRIALFMHDNAVNRIEQHNFSRLIKQGVVVNG